VSETWSPESKPEYIGADAIRAPYQKMLNRKVASITGHAHICYLLPDLTRQAGASFPRASCGLPSTQDRPVL